MFYRRITKALILFIALGSGFFPFIMSYAQSEFPRISYIDAYWVHRNGKLGNGQTHFGNYEYFWPQMDSCGFTHVVTDGDTVSLIVPDTLRLLNDYLDPTYDVWRYATGVVNDYPVGGIQAHESYFKLKDTGDDYLDPDGDRYVFRMLCDTNSSGVVFDSSFGACDQLMNRDYYFTFRMKLVGDTSDSVEVARVYIWETDASSYYDQSEHRWLTWKDLGGGERGNADDTLIIYSSDFSTSGIYEEIELEPIYLWAEQKDTHITFEWLDTKDLYIDHLNVRDQWNYDLFVSQDSSDNFEYIQDTLQSRYDINPVRNYRFYVDEPAANQYPSYGKVNDLAKVKPAVSLNGATGGRTKYDLQIFVSRVDPTELLYNRYTIEVDTDTFSSGPNSLQNAWYRLVSEPKGNGWTHFGMRAATTVADFAEIPFWMTIQACKESYFSDEWHRLRAPTRNELFAEAHLALCYGAKGIMYYDYPSFIYEHDDHTDTLCGLVDLVNGSDEPTWDLKALDSHYIPNYRWYAAQEINAKIDSLDDVLLDLNWKSAFVSHPDSINTYATFIESLYSDDFGTDTSFVEIGEFQHNDGTYYLMLVNRRCLRSESQTVSFWIESGHEAYDSYFLQDIYNHDVYGVVNGQISEILLAPGEGKLFKLVDSDAIWSGIVNVQGSVTIPQGVQLIIEPASVVKFAPDSDLQINGVLQAKGSPGGPSIYLTALDTTKQWNGILFTNSSNDALCTMKNCWVEYATSGITCNNASPDTIDNIFIRHCDYGIKCIDNSSPLISAITMWDGTVPIVIYCASNSNPMIDEVWLDGNDVIDSKGIQIVDSDPVIQGGSIYHFDRGIDICGGNPDISGVELLYNMECAIACNIEGECEPCSAYIANNVIFSNQIGVKSVDASPIVYRNRIMGNESTGVWCSGTDTPNLGVDATSDSGYNEICNDLWNVYSESSETIKAERNWWGDVPPDSSQFYGLIDYLPYLLQSPDSTIPERVTDLTATLSKSDICLQWSAVTTDIDGKSELIKYYVVYRDTEPEFFPEPSDAIANAKLTSYLDTSVVGSPHISYYYAVRAVDYGENFSYESNQVGEFEIDLTKEGGDDIPEFPED